MKEYAAGFIMIWVVVWIVAGFFGYLFADESRFRCHDGGFAVRVASGLVYGTAEPLRELWEAGKNAREILETIHDLPEFKPNEPESHLKGIFGCVFRLHRWFEVLASLNTLELALLRLLHHHVDQNLKVTTRSVGGASQNLKTTTPFVS